MSFYRRIINLHSDRSFNKMTIYSISEVSADGSVSSSSRFAAFSSSNIRERQSQDSNCAHSLVAFLLLVKEASYSREPIGAAKGKTQFRLSGGDAPGQLQVRLLGIRIGMFVIDSPTRNGIQAVHMKIRKIFGYFENRYFFSSNPPLVVRPAVQSRRKAFDVQPPPTSTVQPKAGQLGTPM